ncbi:MAG: ParB N-terminal domain-containing protein [Candidatus Micrarchaeota archaeon]
MTAGAFEKHFVRVEALRSHEKTSAARLRAVKRSVKRFGVVSRPIIVDARFFVVLDGHHRLAALRELGCRFAPVQFVDYASAAVRVRSRRRGVRVSKRVVMRRALAGREFACKTTRHEHPLKKTPRSAALRALLALPTPLKDLK